MRASIRHSSATTTTQAIHIKVSVTDSETFTLEIPPKSYTTLFLAELTLLRSKQSTSPCGCLWSGSSVLHHTSCWGIYSPADQLLVEDTSQGERFQEQTGEVRENSPQRAFHATCPQDSSAMSSSFKAPDTHSLLHRKLYCLLDSRKKKNRCTSGFPANIFYHAVIVPHPRDSGKHSTQSPEHFQMS